MKLKKTPPWEVVQKTARAVAAVQKKRTSLKTAILGDAQMSAPQRRAAFALATRTLENAGPLGELVDALPKDARAPLRRAEALVLAYQLLISGQLLAGLAAAPAVKQFRASAEQPLQKLAQEFCQAHGVASLAEWVAQHRPAPSKPRPRYVRVNTLAISMEKALEELPTAERDAHLPDELLVLPPGTDLHAHPLVQQGALVLQDKASCLPAFLLAPPAGAAVADACAAPGNKTTHLAAKTGPTGRIVAVDRDATRFLQLERSVKAAGADGWTRCVRKSWLDVDPAVDAWAAETTHVLCDPSCSGSGMARADGSLDSPDASRLLALAEFQFRVVCKALSLPLVERVSYSTCSVHPHENEYVVALLLAAHPQFRLVPRERMLPKWTRRGMPFSADDLAGWGIDDASAPSLSPDDADACIRCLPEDGTHGFFVAVFERIPT